jgi:putative ABC transport system permease protein
MKAIAADAWTGFRCAPARAGLAFAGLALGLFAATLLLATLGALRQQARELVDEFGAGAFALVKSGDEGASAWSRSHVEALRMNLAGSAWASGLKTLRAGAGSGEGIAAIDEAYGAVRGWRFLEGRGLDALDVRMGSRHAVASDGTFRAKGWQVGEGVRLGGEPFRLVGRFSGGETPLPGVPTPIAYVPHTADVPETGSEEDVRRVDALLLRAADGTTPESLRRRVEALLRQPGGGLDGAEWVTPESLLRGIRRWQRAIGWTAGTGGALALLLGAATLAGTLLAGVRERIPEIGLRRALGARRREIAGLFVVESAALSCAAAAAGWLAAEGGVRWMGDRFPLPYHFGWDVRLAPFALAAGIALLCSAGPAWLAARMPPAEALRND